MSGGSWLRFLVGILLSVEVIRLALSGNSSIFAVILAVIYFLLVVSYVIFKF